MTHKKEAAVPGRLPDEGALDEFCAMIGGDLRALRKMKGLTQSQAAETVGVSRYTLTRIEGGDMGVALGTIVALARLYEAPDSFLALMAGRPAQEPAAEGAGHSIG